MAETSTVQVPTFELPHRLARSLEWADVSKVDMAAHLGVSRQTVDNYIHERTPITRGYLHAWATLCGVPFDWLAFGDGEGRTVTGTVTHEYQYLCVGQLEMCYAA